MKALKILLCTILVLIISAAGFYLGTFILTLDFSDKTTDVPFTENTTIYKENAEANLLPAEIPSVNTDKKDEPVNTPALPEETPEKDDNSSLISEKAKAAFTERFKDFGGDLTYALHIYSNGFTLSGGSHRQKSASIIKLFIMDYAYSLIEKGEISKDDVISGKSLSSLIDSMITISDNSATNILIDHFTMDKINAYIKSSGYNDTVLQRRMLDTAAASRGEENYTSANDVMAFLDRLYANKDSFPENEMLSIMKRQTVSTKLRRDMPSGVVMASKTGELSDTENDVGIVFSNGGDYAIVCLSEGGVSSVARDKIAKVCREIYDILNS